MKFNMEIDLDDLRGWDGDSITTVIAEEIKAQLKAKVKREMKADKKVAALVQKMKAAAIAKLMQEFDGND